MKNSLRILSLVLFFSMSILAQAQELTRFSKNGKYGFKDENSKEVIDPIYDNASWSFSNGMAAVKLDGKWGFIDDKGEEIIPIKYDDMGITSYKDGEGYKIYFYEDLLSVYKDKLWGVVDRNGKEIAPLKYQFVTGFSDGLAAIEVEGKWGFINRKGEEVIAPKYDNVDKWYGYCYSEGLAGVQLNGKWGYINKKGDLVIPCKYDKVSYFENGKAWVKVEDEYIDIDKNGKELIKEKVEVKTKSTADNSVYIFVDKMPEFNGGGIAFQNEILGEMVQNPIFKNGNYNTTIIVNKDKTIEVKTISGSGALIDKKMTNALSSIIESKNALKCGYHNSKPVRVQQTLFLKLNDKVRQAE